MREKRNCLRIRSLHLLLLILLAVICMTAGTRKVSAATAGFKTIKGKTYYIDANGKKHKGWLRLGKRRYYLNYKTGVLTTGWQTTKKGKRYFSAKKGVLTVGWKSFGTKKLRYFDPKTGFMKTGWYKDSAGKRYYFSKSTGYAVTGWQKSGTKKRYFDPKTGVMAEGWHTSSTGAHRYFDPKTGYMYQNTKAVIDGKSYTFAKNGVATENSGGSVIPTVTDLTFLVYDSTNAKYYTIMKEYKTHPGIADGTKSDLDILAAVCECEAGDQGIVGMEAVALTILNRTIDKNREFPSTVRYVLYHGTTFPQYSVVTNGNLLKRLNGQFDNREAAYKAAQAALDLFNNYVNKGTKRTLKGFDTKDFNYKYFMMESYFWQQPLDFDKVEYCKYKDHIFFVDWVSP